MPEQSEITLGRGTGRLSRRLFMQNTTMLTGVVAASALGLRPAAAAGDAAIPFMTVSEFLTSRKLDPQLGNRFLASLVKHDPNFTGALTNLLAAIQQAHAPDMDAFLAQGTMDKALLKTATTIVSAWYTGVVGTGANAELISFADALMYVPTRDVTVVPTYGRAPLYWTQTPPTE